MTHESRTELYTQHWNVLEAHDIEDELSNAAKIRGDISSANEHAAKRNALGHQSAIIQQKMANLARDPEGYR